ncbi:MAG: hypothetical protein JSR52_13560 [Planctomycetes bacterium]|nr:hypothetical protein [Planctomycetota bacterium]
MSHNQILRLSTLLDKSDPIERLRERMLQRAGNESYTSIGHKTATHPETVRRYLSVGVPSVRFVQSFADAFSVSAEWLLLGRGCMNREEIVRTSIGRATVEQLMQALAERLGTQERFLRELVEKAPPQAPKPRSLPARRFRGASNYTQGT